MATTIDHLRADVAVRVLRSFVDARGVRHAEGERGVILEIRLDWPRQEIVLHWKRDGREESMPFPLQGTEGPGNGRMREFFAVDEEEASERPRPPHPRGPILHLPPPGQPPLSIDDAGAGAGRAAALADHRRFEEALIELRACRLPPDDIARTLTWAAERRVLEPDGAVYHWLRDRAIDCWYAWGSQATSGGEGAVKLLTMEPAFARFKALDAERARRLGDGAAECTSTGVDA